MALGVPRLSMSFFASPATDSCAGAADAGGGGASERSRSSPALPMVGTSSLCTAGVGGEGIALRFAQRPDLGLADPDGAIDRHEQPPEPLARIRNGVRIARPHRVQLLRGWAARDGLAGPALLLRDLADEPLIALVSG